MKECDNNLEEDNDEDCQSSLLMCLVSKVFIAFLVGGGNGEEEANGGKEAICNVEVKVNHVPVATFCEEGYIAQQYGTNGNWSADTPGDGHEEPMSDPQRMGRFCWVLETDNALAIGGRIWVARRDVAAFL